MTSHNPARERSIDHPILWTVSISRLSDLFRDIAREFDDQADIEPLNVGFDDAVRHIRERLQHERCDAVIAAGSNAAYLKSRLSIPVVIASASGFDVMQALTRARKVSNSIGLINYQETFHELAEFEAAFKLDIMQRTYVTEEDARARIYEMKAAGITAIVGAGLITDLAEEAGMAGIFIYSAASIRLAFGEALELARRSHSETGPGRHHPNNDRLRTRHRLQDLRGQSAAMEVTRQSIALFARSPASVLIYGETGSGKELAAQAIHREYVHNDNPAAEDKKGVRSLPARPFIAVNCGALTESLLESELFGYEDGAFTGSRRGGRPGLFEAANRGTLFLDEIGEMPLSLQTRLLRVLEERAVVRVGSSRPIAVDVRIVSATHCDLEGMVANGLFRADLYYRLAVLRLRLPPLRERPEDIGALALWCLKNAMAALDARPRVDLAAEIQTCMPLLGAYAWPGNVRELRNLMERVALFMADTPLQALTPAFLKSVAPELAAAASIATATAAPPALAGPTDSNAPQESLQQILERFGDNREAAANYLGISRTTLWRRLKQDQAQDR
jgi:propionate catabolism operon transcriptional regulator